jgi:hypothetical protein
MKGYLPPPPPPPGLLDGHMALKQNFSIPLMATPSVNRTVSHFQASFYLPAAAYWHKIHQEQMLAPQHFYSETGKENFAFEWAN